MSVFVQRLNAAFCANRVVLDKQTHVFSCPTRIESHQEIVVTDESIYDRETRVIEKAEILAGKDEFAKNPLQHAYLELLSEYKKLFSQTRRLVKMSDRMQKKLNELNTELQEHKEILSRMSYVDGLTTIANRRRFDECIATEWNRDKRDRRPLALLLLDLDFFKQYNDQYGHSAGDECLRKVAQALVKSVNRAGDLVARYGGEEFAILLPETELAGAMQVGTKVQTNIRNLAIVHEYSRIAPIVTVSIGAAVMVPNEQCGFQDLIEAADRQLYAAKESGRNQIKAKVISNDESHPEVLRAT